MNLPQNRRHLFSIGHVAKTTGVAVSTLRSWEALGLLAPFKSDAGHRFYSMEDIDRVRCIGRMRRIDGQSLTTIRRALDAREGDAREEDEPACAVAGEGAGAEGEAGTWVDFNRVGAKVRAWRKEAGLSLRELSLLTDIAVSHLSTFERGSAYLSPSRLNAVAQVFKRTLAELLGGTDALEIPIVRRGQGRVVGSFGPGVTIQQLTVSQRLMDAEVWTIEPGRESDGFYSHEGEELIFLLEGALEIELASRAPEVLKAGDCAYFNSRIGHRWRNTGEQNVVALWVNTDSKRLSSMSFEKDDRRLNLGASFGTGFGEGALSLDVPDGAQTLRVVETHTAGHPTRILIEPLQGLDGASVAEKAQQFRLKYDYLRPLLLHEPRGHSGSFGLVPVPSAVADFGAFFVSSHGYPMMCGHAIIGYAKALQLLGPARRRDEFTIEMPGGVVTVRIGLQGEGSISIDLPAAHVIERWRRIAAGGREFSVSTVFCGECFAIIDADAAGLALEPAHVDELLALGESLKEHLNAAMPRQEGKLPSVESVLFISSGSEGGVPRQFLAIDRRKFDRSPGATALAARLAALVAESAPDAGLPAPVEVESVFGGRLRGEVIAIGQSGEVEEFVSVRVTGYAHLNGISTLIHEPDDRIGTGFL